MGCNMFSWTWWLWALAVIRDLTLPWLVALHHLLCLYGIACIGLMGHHRGHFARDPAKYNWSILYISFCHWIPQSHDGRRVGDAFNGDYGWVIYHRLLWCAHSLFHPLFWLRRQYRRWRCENVVNVGLEKGRRRHPLVVVPTMLPSVANSSVSSRRCWCDVSGGN